ncbi:methyl-accepting chemotaxis protein [Pseudoduganella namucuonensis]|uniref:Methyl-accepting chemotaxis sensory transducer n=1 Tax=Pseudoduganella namucuonensis TaxID=1035707 RepID=A0A1I7FJT2_9BURK|nr:methyl-accepting chemotaxis protein [Pseudoduganella namucuonensis]SFU36395.1 methyl-accepting chemotaxis sensory transducer [Pseudoduganella namucuonensis]
MKLANLKIGVRLALLSGFFFFALLVVGVEGWRALNFIKDRNAEGMQRSVTLTQAVDTARGAQVEFKIQVQEWKNILLRGSDPASFDKYSQAFVKTGKQVNGELLKLQALLDRLNLKTPLVAEAIRMHEELGANYLRALKQYDPAHPDGHKVVDGLVKGMDRAPTKKIDDIVLFIGEQSRRLAAEMAADNEAAHRNATISLLVMMAATLLLGSVLVVWMIRGITRPLNQAIGIAQTVAAGDLRCDVETSRQDEVGELLRALKRMSDNLADIVGRVRAGTDTIATASREIATGNQDLSNRTEEQASSLEETASSMVELTSTVRQNNDNASQARELAHSASAVAVKGGATVADVVRTMEQINESSRRIVDIIGVIDGIAFQTNILALNAAVEAARAGEQGRGFAVVASEVRNLAQRSAAAAKEIKELIGTSVERVAAGSSLVGKAGVTMSEVVASVERVNAIIGEIALASTEQQDGIEQIGTAISHMDGVTQQNAALVEQAAAAAESLQRQAQNLTEAVSFFKLHDRDGAAGVPQAPSASRALRAPPRNQTVQT